jgi:hypothetical protein
MGKGLLYLCGFNSGKEFGLIVFACKECDILDKLLLNQEYFAVFKLSFLGHTVCKFLANDSSATINKPWDLQTLFSKNVVCHVLADSEFVYIMIMHHVQHHFPSSSMLYLSYVDGVLEVTSTR